jgi:pseudouridine-5'-phosphate glycosidase
MGATTVSATLWVAHRAGIDVMTTGGIGGVHVGSGDVSADLLELSRTPGTVVCSGPKSIVEPALTLERLEELGVGLVGYRCDRLPFFLVRETHIELEHRADSPQDVAALAASSRALGIDSAVVVCNPIPEGWAMDAGEVDAAVKACLGEALSAGLAGKAVTPFLLSCLARRTNGRSIDANIALLESNARLAAEVALSAGGL